MKNCVWLKLELVAQIEFTEWTPDGHLRHSRFVGLREDKRRGKLCGRAKTACCLGLFQELDFCQSFKLNPLYFRNMCISSNRVK
jgi:hypothetical protein